MKTILASAGVLVFAVVLGLVAPGTLRAESCGDTDGSGTITVTDGVNVLRQAAGLSSACSTDATRCDADGSGSVTVTDGVNVLRHAAGLGATLACPNGSTGVERFAGNYRGVFTGDDQGTFDVDVACDGAITGAAFSTFFDEVFDVTGQTVEDGGVTFTVGSVTGGATFSGTIDEDHHVEGQWSNDFEDSSGTFAGDRSRRRGPACP